MKDRMESFLVLPFSIHCATHSSIDDVAITQSKKPRIGTNALLTRRKEVDERSKVMKMKRSWGFLALRRCFISRRIHKLIITALKSFSQLFVYNEEEEEMEMEIGYPTDVKHVTHIGLDGSMTTTNPVKEEKAISLSQFELAMAAQATTHVLASLP